MLLSDETMLSSEHIHTRRGKKKNNILNLGKVTVKLAKVLQCLPSTQDNELFRKVDACPEVTVIQYFSMDSVLSYWS